MKYFKEVILLLLIAFNSQAQELYHGNLNTKIQQSIFSDLTYQSGNRELKVSMDPFDNLCSLTLTNNEDSSVFYKESVHFQKHAKSSFYIEKGIIPAKTSFVLDNHKGKYVYHITRTKRKEGNTYITIMDSTLNDIKFVRVKRRFNKRLEIDNIFSNDNRIWIVGHYGIHRERKLRVIILDKKTLDRISDNEIDTDWNFEFFDGIVDKSSLNIVCRGSQKRNMFNRKHKFLSLYRINENGEILVNNKLDNIIKLNFNNRENNIFWSKIIKDEDSEKYYLFGEIFKTKTANRYYLESLVFSAVTFGIFSYSWDFLKLKNLCRVEIDKDLNPLDIKLFDLPEYDVKVMNRIGEISDYKYYKIAKRLGLINLYDVLDKNTVWVRDKNGLVEKRNLEKQYESH